MRRFRARLAVTAVGLLLLQLSAAAVSTLNMCCAETPASSSAMQCCREGGEGHICPFMKKDAGSSSQCRMRACGGRYDHAIPLSGLIGLLAPQVEFVLEASSLPIADFTAAPLHRTPIPESPPPRS